MAKAGRKPRADMVAGRKFGHLTIVMRVNTKPGANGGQRYRVECVCGTRLTVPSFYLTRQNAPKTHCGCKAKEGVNPYPREKGIWNMMHQRCENPEHVSYMSYGGATPPVTIHPDFHKSNPQGWENFIAHVGPAPSKKHTLDRINPFKGYEPGNLRWATAKQQANNQRQHHKAPVTT